MIFLVADNNQKRPEYEINLCSRNVRRLAQINTAPCNQYFIKIDANKSY